MPDTSLATADAFVDAFYSWDRARLAALVLPGTDADAVLYYQAWAEAAHYQVEHRLPCRELPEGTVVCAITVTDDFGLALGYTATDTFTLTVVDDRVATVTFEGDDPPIFQAVFRWLAETRPEVFDGPCRDLFAGGQTPGDCARAVAQGARDYAARLAE
ncbi:MAG: hypothetical protein AB7I04_00145 [Pseudomonadales bacterium]